MRTLTTRAAAPLSRRAGHNPQVVAYNGGFALFHIGSGVNGHPQNCSSGAGDGADARGRAALPPAAAAAPPRGSALHTASSLEGPWQPVLSGAPPSCNNPAPARHPNGTWFLICDSRVLLRLDGAPEAPIGNWSEVAQLVPGAGAVRGSYEDAFLFFGPADPPTWHVLFHIWTSDTNITSCESTTVSGLAFSRDGLEWQFSESLARACAVARARARARAESQRASLPAHLHAPGSPSAPTPARAWRAGQQQPYGPEVVFADGSRKLLPTRERPKLLLDAQRQPTFLVNGACGGATSCLPFWCSHCKQSAWDFTLVQPVAGAGRQR